MAEDYQNFDGKVQITHSAVGTLESNFDGKILTYSSSLNDFDGRVSIAYVSYDDFDGRVLLYNSSSNDFDGKILTYSNSSNDFDGRVSIAYVSYNEFDGKILIYNSLSNDIDGRILLYSETSDDFDGKIQVVNSVSNGFDGKVLTYSNSPNDFDGKIAIGRYIDGNFTYAFHRDLDGKIIVYSYDSNDFDGRVSVGRGYPYDFYGLILIYTSTYIALDGLVEIVSSAGSEADLDGRVRIGYGSTNELDGKIAVHTRYEYSLDGKVLIYDSSSPDLDGKVIIWASGVTVDLDGKVVLHTYAESDFDGRIQISPNSSDDFDGKILVYDSSTSDLDGKLIIWSSTTVDLDGRVRIGYSSASEFDGKMFIIYSSNNSLDGKVLIWTTGFDSFDGRVSIANTTFDDFDGRVRVRVQGSDDFDGKILLYVVGQSAIELDGKIIIELSSVQSFDGRVYIERPSSPDFDGKIILYSYFQSDLDGRVRIGYGSPVGLDGRVRIGYGSSGDLDGFIRFYEYDTPRLDGYVKIYYSALDVVRFTEDSESSGQSGDILTLRARITNIDGDGVRGVPLRFLHLSGTQIGILQGGDEDQSDLFITNADGVVTCTLTLDTIGTGQYRVESQGTDVEWLYDDISVRCDTPVLFSFHINNAFDDVVYPIRTYNQNSISFNGNMDTRTVAIIGLGHREEYLDNEAIDNVVIAEETDGYATDRLYTLFDDDTGAGRYFRTSVYPIVSDSLRVYRTYKGSEILLSSDEYECSEQYGYIVLDHPLDVDDTLRVSYVAEPDLNDPELFTKFEDLEDKYGSPSSNNTLSLAAKMAFENGAIRVLACQASESDSYFTDAYAALEKEECYWIVPVPKIGTTYSYVISAGKTHVTKMSSTRQRRERILLCGEVENSAEDLTRDDVLIIDSERVMLFTPSVISRVVGGETLTLDGRFVAAAAAGRLSGLDHISYPLTNKTLQGFTMDKRYGMTAHRNRLTDTGVTFVQHLLTGGEVWHGVTTIQDGVVENQEISIIRLRDYLIKNIRTKLDKHYIGKVVDEMLTTDVYLSVVNMLNRLVSEEIIKTFNNVKVKQDSVESRQLNVTFDVEPIYPFNAISVVIGFLT